MRWIDIVLPETGKFPTTDALLEQATARLHDWEELLAREGLDGPGVAERSAEIGGLLFQAVLAGDPEAFSPAPERPGSRTPDLDVPELDALVGYHLVCAPPLTSLPWHWLHNGLGFLLERHPVCAAQTPSALPEGAARRPWMQRMVRAGFLVGEDGSASLRHTLPQLRPNAAPEVLFVAGHVEPKIRRLIAREAEAIETALAGGPLGDPLVRMTFPTAAVTPSQLRRQGLVFQAIHFAAPTSRPALMASSAGEYWMDRLLEEVAATPDEDLETTLGLEGELLGVDPVTAVLDAVSDSYLSRGGAADALPVGEAQAQGGGPGERGGLDSLRRGGSWLLEDGPLHPEAMGHGGGIPPLVFSNSFRAMPELGPRFTAAGASTFIGPALPLFSRPARLFAGHCYDALAEGWCVGAAVWRAARACRAELGPQHPAWLGYGVLGYGSLALQYL